MADLKSIFPSSIMQANADVLTLEIIAGKLTHFHEQLHFLHWQTLSYAEHQALGALYDYVHTFKDDIVEKIMGYCGKRPSLFKIDPLTHTTPVAVVDELLTFATKLKHYGEQYSYHDVCNMADALSGEVAKTKYLLTLS